MLKAIISPTEQMVNVTGQMAQVWIGVTSQGQPLEVFVVGVRGEDQVTTLKLASDFGLAGELKDEGEA